MVQRLRLVDIGRLYPVHPNLDTVIEDAVVCVSDGKVDWVGPKNEAPELALGEDSVSLQGAMVTPGWVDSHTHLIWAGSRQHEFRQRLEGKTYLDIAKAGGGIMSTVREVRKASLEQLITDGRKRLQRLLSFGVTSLEIKSGYGLDTDSEVKMLEAAKALDATSPQTIATTFLGAHTVPTEFKPKRADYLDLVCNEMIPLVAERKLADACDVFVEEGAFSLDEARRVLETGKQYGLRPRVHADQLSPMGGAQLAAELGAASADHLEDIDEEGIQALADAGVVACMIPGSTFCLRQGKYAPARALLEAGVTLAIATDLNPGTTCSENLALIGSIAATQMGLTPLEVLHALTRGGAFSLGHADSLGSLAPGYQADLVVFDAPDIDYIFYHYGISHVSQVYMKGELSFEAAL